jgi:uncharacterized protein (DUF2342 family)
MREPAHRSFHAINSVAQPVAETRARSKYVVQDLRDQVAWLQHKMDARKLDSLIPGVDALRRQFDNRLGDAGKAEQCCGDGPVTAKGRTARARHISQGYMVILLA